MKIKIIIILLFFIVSNYKAISYVKTDSTYKVQITASGGYSLGVSNFHSEYSDQIIKNDFAFAFRFQLHTKYILSIGAESGLLKVADLNTNDIKAELEAYPILLLFTYSLTPLRINTGIGYYNIYSKISDETGESKSNSFEFGFMASLQYNYQLTKKFGLGVEAKYYNIAESSKSLIAIMANINYVLIEW